MNIYLEKNSYQEGFPVKKPLMHILIALLLMEILYITPIAYSNAGSVKEAIYVGMDYKYVAITYYTERTTDFLTFTDYFNPQQDFYTNVLHVSVTYYPGMKALKVSIRYDFSDIENISERQRILNAGLDYAWNFVGMYCINVNKTVLGDIEKDDTIDAFVSGEMFNETRFIVDILGSLSSQDYGLAKVYSSLKHIEWYWIDNIDYHYSIDWLTGAPSLRYTLRLATYTAYIAGGGVTHKIALSNMFSYVGGSMPENTGSGSAIQYIFPWDVTVINCSGGCTITSSEEYQKVYVTWDLYAGDNIEDCYVYINYTIPYPGWSCWYEDVEIDFVYYKNIVARVQSGAFNWEIKIPEALREDLTYIMIRYGERQSGSTFTISLSYENTFEGLDPYVVETIAGNTMEIIVSAYPEIFNYTLTSVRNSTGWDGTVYAMSLTYTVEGDGREFFNSHVRPKIPGDSVLSVLADKLWEGGFVSYGYTVTIDEKPDVTEHYAGYMHVIEISLGHGKDLPGGENVRVDILELIGIDKLVFSTKCIARPQILLSLPVDELLSAEPEPEGVSLPLASWRVEPGTILEHLYITYNYPSGPQATTTLPSTTLPPVTTSGPPVSTTGSSATSPETTPATSASTPAASATVSTTPASSTPSNVSTSASVSPTTGVPTDITSTAILAGIFIAILVALVFVFMKAKK